MVEKKVRDHGSKRNFASVGLDLWTFAQLSFLCAQERKLGPLERGGTLSGAEAAGKVRAAIVHSSFKFFVCGRKIAMAQLQHQPIGLTKLASDHSKRLVPCSSRSSPHQEMIVLNSVGCR